MFRASVESPFHLALTCIGLTPLGALFQTNWYAPDVVSVLFAIKVQVLSLGFAYCKITCILLVTGWPLGPVRVPVILLILLPLFGTYGLLSVAVKVGV